MYHVLLYYLYVYLSHIFGHLLLTFMFSLFIRINNEYFNYSFYFYVRYNEQPCTCIDSSVPTYTCINSSVPTCTCIDSSVPTCTCIDSSVPTCTCIDSSVPTCTCALSVVFLETCTAYV